MYNRIVIYSAVLDYGKTKPCTADLFGMALVNPVKPFKYTALLIGRNTMPSSLDRKLSVRYYNLGVTSGAVVFYGVVAEV